MKTSPSEIINIGIKVMEILTFCMLCVKEKNEC